VLANETGDDLGRLLAGTEKTIVLLLAEVDRRRTPSAPARPTVDVDKNWRIRTLPIRLMVVRLQSIRETSMSPNAPVDPAERFRREHAREMDSQERLRDRVSSAVGRLARETSLFQQRPELGDPDVIVQAYLQFVLVNVCLNPGQIRIVPFEGRIPALDRFTEELKVGVERIARELHLVFEPGAGPFGTTGPIGVLPPSTPGGYQAVLVRPRTEGSARFGLGHLFGPHVEPRSQSPSNEGIG
jgi:hypothetical protein